MKKFSLLIVLFLLNACALDPKPTPSDGTTHRSSSSHEDVEIEPAKKFALVIGNSKYEHAKLRNPKRDAKDVSVVLGQIGFDVDKHLDLKDGEMKQAVDDFVKKLRANPQSVGLFYYAGHGARANNGNNYLLPINNKNIDREDQLAFKAIDARDVMTQMQDIGKAQVSILILDACRNNPFRGTRSLNRGLNSMSSASGSIIIFAADEGQTAADGVGRNGLFTKHLLHMLKQAYSNNIRIDDMFQNIRNGVVNETGGKQEPWYSASLSSPYCLRDNTQCGSGIIMQTSQSDDFFDDDPFEHIERGDITPLPIPAP
ncbi:MAG: caspase family protein [Thiotrichaceae bacterium]|nr:caspase family protein [Thiotrichaceae bacterium]